MSIVRANIKKVHSNHNDVMDEPIANKPYAFASTRKFDSHAGHQYRWPGEYIREVCEKHAISFKEFTEIVNGIGETNYGTTVSYGMMLVYINGRQYNRMTKCESFEDAYKIVDLENAYLKKSGRQPRAEVLIKQRKLSTGRNVTTYTACVPMHHCVCPKIDIFNACADAIEQIDGTREAFVKMAGRVYFKRSVWKEAV